MPWKKVPPELVEFLDRAVVPYQTERRFMFGSPVHFVNHNMFVGAHEDRIMLRLPAEAQAELFAAHPDAQPFEVMGRRMREYVLLPQSAYQDEPFFERWLRRSYAYTASLPTRPIKARKRKAR